MSSTEGLVDERYFDELASAAIPALIDVIRKAMVKHFLKIYYIACLIICMIFSVA
jgi:hypothetical protein